MAIPITIPRLGWNMEQGVFVGWLKRDGEAVKAGEPVYTLESEKAAQDIECLDSGIFHIPPNGPKEGDTLAVGTVIAFVLQHGEPPPSAWQPMARPLALAEPSAKATAPITPTDRPGSRRQPISPRAKRIAAELGIDWSKIRGSGRTGRIREIDVRATRAPASAASGSDTVRQTIAERMLLSHRSTAPVTLTSTADAANLVNLHRQFKTAGSTHEAAPGYGDLLVKLCALALRDHPSLNARWENECVVLLPDIHIGIAVDTPVGLYVPVIRNPLALSLREVAARSRDLVERARNRKLRAEEMQGGTFTVTNLGSFGIDAFTPIINYPQCAILGVGRIQRRPVVRDEQIVIGDEITLSLTFDHRVVDGAPAARFLQALCRLIENPLPL